MPLREGGPTVPYNVAPDSAYRKKKKAYLKKKEGGEKNVKSSQISTCTFSFVLILRHNFFVWETHNVLY